MPRLRNAAGVVVSVDDDLAALLGSEWVDADATDDTTDATATGDGDGDDTGDGEGDGEDDDEATDDEPETPVTPAKPTQGRRSTTK